MKFRRIIPVALLMAVLALLFMIQPARPTAARTGGRQVWVFYMGFWNGPGAWQYNANVMIDAPLIGQYNSQDPGVAGMQIEQAQSAGIDAFIVSWFGPDDVWVTNPTLNNLLDRAAERGFEVGAAVDIFNANFDRGRIVSVLNYLIGNRVGHPAYLRYDGKPVIFFAFQDRANLSAEEWQSIRAEVDPNHNTIWIAEGLNGCCIYGGAMDGMYAFNIAWANGSSARIIRERNAVFARGGTYYIPTAHPGWDETLVAARDNRPNPTSPRPRNNGAFMRRTWNAAIAARQNVVLIVSWNEFIENSHIEPSVLYGNQSLDVLRPLIARWESSTTGGGASPTPPVGAPTGQVVEARQTVNVRAGPGTSYQVIGQIMPGTTYPVVGQTTGWYAIQYNNQIGWVSATLVTVH